MILRLVEFSFVMLSPKWVSVALQTITKDNKNLKWITIDATYLPTNSDDFPVPSFHRNSGTAVRDAAIAAYSELDHLVEFHDSRPITPLILCPMSFHAVMKKLLPDLVRLEAGKIRSMFRRLRP